MKQCPNPNCILYTRLEELPDAYLKCPGCGGLLVVLEGQSGNLASGRLSNRRLPGGPASTPRGASSHQPPPAQPSYAPPLPDDSDPYDPYGVSGPYDPYAPLQPVQPAQPRVTGGSSASRQATTGQHGAAQAAMSSPVSPAAYVSTSQLNTAKWTTASKVAFGVGSVLLLLACGLLGWIFSNRFFPQSRVIASPQATETALALVRPPVNTPIMQPSLTTLAGNFPGPTIVVPTPAIEEPTPLVTVLTQAAPTQASQVIDPTVPPAQPEPLGGVIEAHMTSGQGGPTTEYGPNEPFSLAAQATFGPGNVTNVLTRWYGPDGAQVYAMQKDYTQPGTYYVAFTVRKSTPWLPGTYRVDIYTNNYPTPAYSVFFTVVG